MESIEKYIQKTEYAIKSQLNLINIYENENRNNFFKLLTKVETTTEEEINSFRNEFDSKIYLKNVIAGSIVQIAYMSIKLYSKNKEKNTVIKSIENDVNQNKEKYKSRNPQKDKRFLEETYKFGFNKKFCIGREIAGMPIGLIIYAARNQYNHVDERVMELSLENKLILNYIYQLYPEKVNDLDLNIYDDKNIHKYFSYSILSLLGWTHLSSENPYKNYEQDIKDFFIS